MANWQTFNLSSLVPSEVTDAATAVSGVASTISTALGVVKSALELSATFAAAAVGNPVEATLATAINQIQHILDGLATNTNAHAILIPVQKQYLGPGVTLPPMEVRNDTVPNFNHLLQSGAFPGIRPTSVPNETLNFINSASISTSGNQVFWKTFMQSLYDFGDYQRPLYTSNFAVAGVCVLCGANTLQELQRNFAFLNSFFPLGVRGDIANHTRPILNGLRAHAVPNFSGNGAQLGVELEWIPVPATQTTPFYGNNQLINKEIFVVRSMDPALRERFTWSEVFGAEPTDTGLPFNDFATCVARIPNDGSVAQYFDFDATLDPTKTYFYTTAVRYSYGDAVQPMTNFSNCVPIAPGRPSQSRRSEPPDWTTTANLIQLFPPIQDILNQVRQLTASVNQLAASNAGALNAINQTVRQIEFIIARLNLVVGVMNSTIQRLANILTTSLAATSATVFSVDSGGVDAWGAELGRRLSDRSDPSRPPFDGSEFVAGLIILAGAPNPAQLLGITALLDLLFGAAANNPLLAAINSITPVPAVAPIIAFGPDLSPIAAPATAPPTPGFDPAMRPTSNPIC